MSLKENIPENMDVLSSPSSRCSSLEPIVKREELPSLSSLSVQQGYTLEDSFACSKSYFLPPTPVVSPLPDRVNLKKRKLVSPETDARQEKMQKIVPKSNNIVFSKSVVTYDRKLIEDLKKTKRETHRMKDKARRRNKHQPLGYLAITSAFFRAAVERSIQFNPAGATKDSHPSSDNESCDSSSMKVAVSVG